MAVLVGVACSTGRATPAVVSAPAGSGRSGSPPRGEAAAGIGKIKHVVVVMQENRSFDSYFGTYPGADGIPMSNGVPTGCVPDTRAGTCVKPYPDHADVNGGGPHGQSNAAADINGGKMDGFVGQVAGAKKGCVDPNNPACANAKTPDVMGYHTQSDIPNYWTYARDFVLQDRMFEPNSSWCLPEHLFMVSEWSAACSQHDNPASCVNALQKPGNPSDAGGTRRQAPIYAWTDLTYLLHRNNVSWGYYVVSGTEPDCQNEMALSCLPVKQNAKTPGIWNPLPYFDTVKADGQLGNITSVDSFYRAAAAGNLLPTCCSPDNPPKYPPLRAGDYLLAELLGPRALTGSRHFGRGGTAGSGRVPGSPTG